MFFTQRCFQLMVPSNVEGLCVERKAPVLVESSLSELASRLSFTTHDVPGYPPRAQNFYYQYPWRIFVVGSTIKTFLLQHIPKDMEFARTTVLFADGRVPKEEYFAAKVTRIIDCVDPTSSFFKSKPFYQLAKTSEDSESTANSVHVKNGNVVTYPSCSGADQVHIIEDHIPPDALLFVPKFCPSELLVEKKFADSLAAACTGGALGYYFWTLGLNSPDSYYWEMAKDMR